MRVVIVGAGGHAQVIADALFALRECGESLEVAGFLDDDVQLLGRKFVGLPVLGTTAMLDQHPVDGVIVGIGDNRTRASVFERLRQREIPLVRVVHPSAVIGRGVEIGEGTVVFAGSVVNTGAVIGVNVIVNTGATVDHHCQIGSHAHVGPGSHLAGHVCIEEGAFLGIGSSVTPGRRIGAWCVVGAGAAVVNDLPAGITAVGVPAKAV